MLQGRGRSKMTLNTGSCHMHRMQSEDIIYSVQCMQTCKKESEIARVVIFCVKALEIGYKLDTKE
jgi:hypothetical protein